MPGLNPDEYETRQVRYKSKDGTQIPMFIVGTKGQRGAAPCLLYGMYYHHLQCNLYMNVYELAIHTLVASFVLYSFSAVSCHL